MTREKALALRALIEKAAVGLTDEDALGGVELFPVWQGEKAYAADERIRYVGKLYRCVQAHTSQADWTPDAVPAIYEVIPNANEDGTQEKPIAYTIGMRVFEGLYYTEDEVLYICTRDSGIPLFNALSDLEGLYMERVVTE